MARDVQVPAGTDLKFWLWNNYEIEEDWDYGFVEVSVDGGTTWAQQRVYTEGGALVSTDDDYTDPNGNLVAFGNKRYGLTGNTDGWRHDYVDLAPFAGKAIKLRLAYNTDAAYTPRGWHADDFALKNMSGRVQSSNAAFSFAKTYPFTECIEGLDEPFSAYCTKVDGLKGVSEFTDAKTWYPGFEARGDSLLLRDADASTVIPSAGDQMYSTRVVNPDGSPATQAYGIDMGGGHVLGSGNPGDEGKALSVKLKLITPLPGNLGAIVQVTPPKK
ncbi:immune inhibitor A [Streptosporangium sp. NBC_01755]|uniref:hypothetical protein n=1 Tax=Streptosporangium sp. NBC_01810 TaxID=2975951 RepID=UPI002DD8E879|nr:hypothetical protein [Streptosporangium sp. NBC_01810]WSA29560.1 immune inhibitor A [Streptosporangium sp. NBC_01810]WSD04011.1 immune inhibitor A [Streptosporangium sp. NBC_01755]